ncbi:S-layer homology domain-containing protein [Paenibacillus sp. IHB B 3415]|uniref:S-layer homology domain-containing protein n=1 Tax=Paenibacillus sp. IHB B 3415 TaxID=867080 RepID=UPI0009F9DF75
MVKSAALNLPRFSGEFSANQPQIPDVQADWSAQAIAQLTQLGIINGYGDGTFRPDASISQAEMVTLLMRMLLTRPIMHTNNQ